MASKPNWEFQLLSNELDTSERELPLLADLSTPIDRRTSYGLLAFLVGISIRTSYGLLAFLVGISIYFYHYTVLGF